MRTLAQKEWLMSSIVLPVGTIGRAGCPPPKTTCPSYFLSVEHCDVIPGNRKKNCWALRSFYKLKTKLNVFFSETWMSHHRTMAFVDLGCLRRCSIERFLSLDSPLRLAALFEIQ